MKKDNSEKVSELIREILKKNPDLTIGELLFGFANFMAFYSCKDPEILGKFINEYLKWMIYHHLKKI